MSDIKSRAGECDENTFWECVAEIGWPVKNVDVTKGNILRAWSPEFGASFQDMRASLSRNLGNAFRDYEESLSGGEVHGYWIGCDGRSDLINHIVGLGKDIYYRELEDCKLVLDRVVQGDYKESFCYVIPHPGSWHGRSFEEWAEGMGFDLREEAFEPRYMDERTFEQYMIATRESYLETTKGDWRRIEADHYAQRASRYLPNLAAFLRALGSATIKDEKEAVWHARVLVRYFNLLINEQTEDAIKLSEDALKSWWALRFIGNEVGSLRSAHADLLPPCSNMPHGGENLINDHREFMGLLEGFKCEFHLNQIREERASA